MHNFKVGQRVRLNPAGRSYTWLKANWFPEPVHVIRKIDGSHFYLASSIEKRYTAKNPVAVDPLDFLLIKSPNKLN